MPDFQDFSITRMTPATMSVPRWRIELRVTDSSTGALVRDFTGANAITFPNVLGQMTPAEQDELVEQFVHWLIRKRAGLD